MKKLYILLLICIFSFSCNKEYFIDSSEPKPLILKSINNFEFNEDGLPLKEGSIINNDTGIRFSYNDLGRLDSIYRTGRDGHHRSRDEIKYTYDANGNLSQIYGFYYFGSYYSTTKLLSHVNNEIIVNEENYNNSSLYFKSKKVYKFKTNKYEYIDSIQILNTFSGSNTSESMIFEYDDNMNVIFVKKDNFDSANLLINSKKYVFEYDNKINPYQTLKKLPPILHFNYIPGIFDDFFKVSELQQTDKSIIKRMLICGKNNLISLKSEFQSNQFNNNTNHSNSFEYNSDGYPIKKRVYNDGVLEKEYTFTYY